MVISRVTTVITHIRGLITPLKTTPEPPSTTVDDINPGVPLKGFIRVPLRGSFTGEFISSTVYPH